MATSADKADYVLSVAVLWGVIGCSGVVMAEEEQPDMEFLEYLGSWEESDEDWLLFDVNDDEVAVVDQKKRTDPAPGGKESTETDDES